MTLVGFDVGGTFTDVVAFEPQSGSFRIAKVPTSGSDPSQGCIDGLEQLGLAARSAHPDSARQVLVSPTEAGTDLMMKAADRRVATYSGGMRRRLDIAMSLIGDPPVIFLDEPTTGLDPQARAEVWASVRELAGRGTTVLLTTQYLDEAERLADRIAILHGGRIIADGTLAELKELFPPATVEYVEKQPTLEEIFLAIVGTADAHN